MGLRSGLLGLRALRSQGSGLLGLRALGSQGSQGKALGSQVSGFLGLRALGSQVSGLLGPGLLGLRVLGSQVSGLLGLRALGGLLGLRALGSRGSWLLLPPCLLDAEDRLQLAVRGEGGAEHLHPPARRMVHVISEPGAQHGCQHEPGPQESKSPSK